MKAKFKRDEKVVVKQDDLYYDGFITDVRRNLFTGAIEYSVDCYKGGAAWTLIGVPESAITPND